MKTLSSDIASATSNAKATRGVARLQLAIARATASGDDRKRTRAQLRLLRSHFAKVLAVHNVAQISRGRHTAGVDGVASLTTGQQRELALKLDIKSPWQAVRQVEIPKKGSSKNRRIGIPIIMDRARQELLRMALAPEWDGRLGRAYFGFRPGRSCHDAIEAIRRHIRSSSKWVLELDIETFFDSLDHAALMEKLGASGVIADSIQKLLKAGAVNQHHGWIPTDEGTPQGGPLSPLLANVALSGLELLLQRIDPRLKLIVYADDIIVLSPDRESLEAALPLIREWLGRLGLRINTTKTKLSHTLYRVDGQAGFDFLGVHIQQHLFKGKRATKKRGGMVTIITPSRKSIQKVYRDIARQIDTWLGNGPAHRRVRDPIAPLIAHLNPVIRGWAEYFRRWNCSKAFSRLDNLVFQKAWIALKKRHRRSSRYWITSYYFGKPGPWVLATKRQDGRTLSLLKFSQFRHLRHIPVQADKAYFDGDWPYWGRRQGTYLGHPPSSMRLLKRQSGRCAECGNPFIVGDRYQVILRPSGIRNIRLLVHQECACICLSAATKPPTTCEQPGALRGARRVKGGQDSKGSNPPPTERAGKTGAPTSNQPAVTSAGFPRAVQPKQIALPVPPAGLAEATAVDPQQ